MENQCIQLTTSMAAALGRRLIGLMDKSNRHQTHATLIFDLAEVRIDSMLETLSALGIAYKVRYRAAGQYEAFEIGGQTFHVDIEAAEYEEED